MLLLLAIDVLIDFTLLECYTINNILSGSILHDCF